MYVRRNYSEPFFRPRPPRRRYRWLWALLLALIAGALYVYTQPQAITNAVLGALGSAPTPLPLPGELVGRAQEAVRAGKLNDAIALYAQALQQRPQNIDFLYDYGQLLVEVNRAEEAVQVGQQIQSLAPQDIRGYALRARALAWLGQGAVAIPIGIAGLGIAPDQPALLEAMTRAYLSENRWRDALDAGERAIELAPDDFRARWAYANALMAVGASAEAIVQLEEANALAPNFLPPYFELAFLYLAQNRDQEAIDLYDRILSIDPRNARALLRQCEAYRKIGEFQRALGICQDAADADLNFAPAQFRLGQLRYSRREFSQAQVAFERCLASDPANLDCHTMLGLTYYYLGQCDTAQSMLEESLRMAAARSLDDTQLINEGLRALARDSACTGNLAPELELDAEATPEATAESTPNS